MDQAVCQTQPAAQEAWLPNLPEPLRGFLQNVSVASIWETLRNLVARSSDLDRRFRY